MDKCLLYGKTAVLSLSLQRTPLSLGAIVLKYKWRSTSFLKKHIKDC